MADQGKDLQAIIATLPAIADVRAGRVELTPEQLAAIDKVNEASQRMYECVAAFAKSLTEWIAAVSPGLFRALSDLAKLAERAGLLSGHEVQSIRHNRREGRRRHSKRVKGR